MEVLCFGDALMQLWHLTKIESSINLSEGALRKHDTEICGNYILYIMSYSAILKDWIFNRIMWLYVCSSLNYFIAIYVFVFIFIEFLLSLKVTLNFNYLQASSLLSTKSKQKTKHEKNAFKVMFDLCLGVYRVMLKLKTCF